MPASQMMEKIRRKIEPLVNEMILSPSLECLDLKIRYVPIAMPKEMHARYPSRSIVKKRLRIIDWAPHLDYSIFVKGSLKSSAIEYVRGLYTSIDEMRLFGVSESQIDEMRWILVIALQKTIEEE